MANVTWSPLKLLSANWMTLGQQGLFIENDIETLKPYQLNVWLQRSSRLELHNNNVSSTHSYSSAKNTRETAQLTHMFCLVGKCIARYLKPVLNSLIK